MGASWGTTNQCTPTTHQRGVDPPFQDERRPPDPVRGKASQKLSCLAGEPAVDFSCQDDQVMPEFGETAFGQNFCSLCFAQLCVCGVCCVGCLNCVCCVCVLCVQDFWWVSSRFLVDVFKIFPSPDRLPPDRPSAGPPLRWTAPPPDRPKSRSFFSSLPPEISFFLLSLRGLLVEFWWCFRRPGRSYVHVWALWLLCETPAGSGPSGLHTTTRDLQTWTFQGPGASNTTKITREDPPEREEKNEFCCRRETKKREILGLPSQTPSGPNPFRPTFQGPTMPTARPAHHQTRPPPQQHPHSTPATNTPPANQKKNWPNAVWPNSVKQSWPNSAKQGWPNGKDRLWPIPFWPS